MLMIGVVIRGRDTNSDDRAHQVRRRVMRIAGVLAMMRRSVRQRGAGSGECDDRDETDRNQAGERRAEHEVNVVDAKSRSESAPLPCRRRSSPLTPCA